MLRKQMQERDGVDADDVIMNPDHARRRGLTSTVCFPSGNLAPEGSVIKATSIPIGHRQRWGTARWARGCVSHRAGCDSRDQDREIKSGDVLVLICRGPHGAGMEETYQLTAALRHLSFGKHVAVVTDARFSGVSTGAASGTYRRKRSPADRCATPAT